MAPLPRPSLPNCYCDPEALPRGHRAKPTETGTRVLGWCRMARGPALLSPCQSHGLPPPAALPRPSALHAPREGEAGGPRPAPCVSPRPHLAWPAPHTGAVSYSYFGSGARGKGRQGQMGSFFILLPPSRPHYPCPESIGGFRLSSDNASINPSVQGWKYSRGHGRFLVFLLPFQCPQA